MSTLMGLVIILGILMILVGGKLGIQAIVSLLFNFFWLFLTITLISFGFSPLIVTSVIGIIILAMTIFLNDDNSQITSVAFFSSITIMIVLMVMIIGVENYANVQGFAVEDSDELEGMSLNIGVSFLKISIVSTILSTLGAIAEAAIAVSSGMYELINDNQEINDSTLLKQGMHIGQQIVSTAINTVFFGFMGSFLGLSIWFGRLKYSFLILLNSKIFVGEFLMIIFSMIAVILTVPTSAIFMKVTFAKRRKNKPY